MTGFGHQPFLSIFATNYRIYEENHIDSVCLGVFHVFLRNDP